VIWRNRDTLHPDVRSTVKRRDVVRFALYE